MEGPVSITVIGDIVDHRGQVTTAKLVNGTSVALTPAVREFCESALICFFGHPEWHGYLVSHSHHGNPFTDRTFRDVTATVEVPARIWRELVGAPDGSQ